MKKVPLGEIEPLQKFTFPMEEMKNILFQKSNKADEEKEGVKISYIKNLKYGYHTIITSDTLVIPEEG